MSVAQHRLVPLPANDQAALRILAQIDPRTFGSRIGRVDQFDFEAGECLQRLGRRGIAFGRRLFLFLGLVLTLQRRPDDDGDDQDGEEEEPLHGKILW